MIRTLRNRIALSLVAASLAFGAACVDDAPTTSAEQALQACETVWFDGKWPQTTTWNGYAPQAISANQLFVILPGDPNRSHYLIAQVDWEQGRVATLTKFAPTKMNAVLRTLAVEPGGINLLGGTRPPIKYPPGTDWGQGLVQIHANLDAVPVIGK